MPALARVLGKNLYVARIRRKRILTAYSYFQGTNRGPCDKKCFFCLCPLEIRTCLGMEPWIWFKLESFQRFLWFQDEVECRWQKYLQTPELVKENIIDLNWGRSLARPLRDFARFAGLFPSEEAAHLKRHVPRSHASKLLTFMKKGAILDLKYRRIMKVQEHHPEIIGPFPGKHQAGGNDTEEGDDPEKVIMDTLRQELKLLHMHRAKNRATKKRQGAAAGNGRSGEAKHGKEGGSEGEEEEEEEEEDYAEEGEEDGEQEDYAEEREEEEEEQEGEDYAEEERGGLRE